jgi:phosphoribosylglycinamide formyltransferase-1
MHNIILFASGKGSNAAAIIDYLKEKSFASVSLIVSNKKDAGVLDIAKKENIPSTVVDKKLFQTDKFVHQIQTFQPSLLVLAGFLWRIPENLINAFPEKIINIHPALLPEFGGKGMYGHHVHEAVLTAEKKESGITIHYVKEVYDSGGIILQARCTLESTEDVNSIAKKIHQLEHFFFPRTIEFLLKQ